VVKIRQMRLLVWLKKINLCRFRT